MNRSEKFVHDLAQSTFLALWTYPSPQRPNKKELTDTLIVCPPDILIMSVKEIELKTGADEETEAGRWLRRAVDASVDQIYGAERILSSMDRVIKADGGEGVALGETADRRIHRIAVAIGAEGRVPISSRDFGKGFVHVFDEQTFFDVLKELDTVTDVVQYLVDREEFFTTSTASAIIGTEQDLLALYISSGRTFAKLSEGHHDLLILDGNWDDLKANPQYLAGKEANKASVTWDMLIDTLHRDFLNGNIEYGGDLESIDRTTRVMARETRFARRVLGQAFFDFLGKADSRARMMVADSGVGYVFLKEKHGEERKYRAAEIHARCFVMRDELDKQGKSGIVIGIATEVPERGSGFSLDTVYLEVLEWNDDLRESARKAREDLGFFKTPRYSKMSADEFPQVN
jgi:hypothetical protein